MGGIFLSEGDTTLDGQRFKAHPPWRSRDRSESPHPFHIGDPSWQHYRTTLHLGTGPCSLRSHDNSESSNPLNISDPSCSSVQNISKPISWRSHDNSLTIFFFRQSLPLPKNWGHHQYIIPPIAQPPTWTTKSFYPAPVSMAGSVLGRRPRQDALQQASRKKAYVLLFSSRLSFYHDTHQFNFGPPHASRSTLRQSHLQLL